MNNLVKKMAVFLAVMVIVAAMGWFGRKAYKHATERRAVAEASQYLAKKDVRNASLCLQRALQINPMSAPASKIMADVLESAGVPAALMWRVRASKLQTNNLDNRLAWAQTAIKLRETASATEALEGLDEKSKSTAAYHKLSGALAWSLGKRDEADQQYREALRLEPNNLAITLNLETIRLASTNNEIASAARIEMEHMATNAQFRMVALHYLAADASTRKVYPKELNYCEEIVRDPAASAADRIEYLGLLHQVHDARFTPWLASMKKTATGSPEEAFAVGKWLAMNQGATNALQWLVSLPPTIQTNQPVPLIIADCNIALKNWTGLITLLEKQDWAEADYFRQALVAFGERSRQQDAAAQVAWHKATRLAARRLDRLARLVQVTAEWGWDRENTQVLTEISSDFPKEKWAMNQLENKFYAAGNTRELASLVGKMYAADSANPKAKNNLANLSLLRKSDMEQAHKLAREAYDSAPENPFFASTYAYSLLLQNKQDEAVKVLSSLKPEYLKNPSVAAYYGVVEAQSGHKDVAKAPLERAAAAELLPEEKEMVRLALARL